MKKKIIGEEEKNEKKVIPGDTRICKKSGSIAIAEKNLIDATFLSNH